jgi:hypothetical protein
MILANDIDCASRRDKACLTSTPPKYFYAIYPYQSIKQRKSRQAGVMKLSPNTAFNAASISTFHGATFTKDCEGQSMVFLG